MVWNEVDEKYLGTCHCGAEAKECGGTYRRELNRVNYVAVCNSCGDVAPISFLEEKLRCSVAICTASRERTCDCTRFTD